MNLFQWEMRPQFESEFYSNLHVSNYIFAAYIVHTSFKTSPINLHKKHFTGTTNLITYYQQMVLLSKMQKGNLSSCKKS